MIPKQRRPGWQYWEVADLLRDGALDIGDGYRAKNSEMGESGLPFARAGNLNDGFHFDDADILSEESVQLAGEKISRPGDITFTSKGTFGRFAIVRENTPQFVYSPQLCYWRVKRDGIVDRTFLYYWMQGEDCMNQLNEVKGLTDMADYVSLTNQRRMWLSAPPLPVQRRIAGILSAYDELMENSQRRIQLLESMTRALYREWFVHFRFPGHEKVKMFRPPSRPGEASAKTDGDIPQGWEVRKLGDTFKTVLGGTPSRVKPEFWEGGMIPWINSGKVNDLRITAPSELITELALERSAAKLMPKGTTVLAITGATLGQVSYLEIETTANQSVVGIVDSSSLCSEWIYLTVSDRIEGIISHASGGAQQHINKEVVNDVLVVLPPVSLAKEFKRLVGPMFREVATLLFKIQNLRRTRDLLLPRLLSGQVEIAPSNGKETNL